MRTITSLLILSLLKVGFAQNDNFPLCATELKKQQIFSNDPSKKQLLNDLNKFTNQWISNQSKNDVTLKKKNIKYIIPVVWHVIHNDGSENISKEQIEQEMILLNQNFQLANSDTADVHPSFANLMANCQIEFRLARLDPEGNCTEGITRTKSIATYSMNDSAKFTAGGESWNRNGKFYMNIWLGKSLEANAVGYAYYPGIVDMDQDGLVLTAANLGNVVTHEAGHWLNLIHPWGGTDFPGLIENCDTDDEVSDTPNTIGQTGCSANSSSCGSIDNVQNFMDYNYCFMMFTEGQKQRMHAALESNIGERNNMWSDSNLVKTGVADPYIENPECVPLGANFTYSKSFICEGEAISFQDYGTYNATLTEWDWIFEGGDPATSNLESPSVTYNSPGVYDVTYVPSSTAGNADTSLKQNIITVSSLEANYIFPFQEGFENTSNFSNDWWIKNTAVNGWENTNTASYSGNRALQVLNLNNEQNDYTELISPSIDLTNAIMPVLEYYWSFAKKTTGGNDQFIIYYSLDCGNSWTIFSVQAGSSLATTSPTDASWIPLMSHDWDYKILDLSALVGNPNVRFKFRLKNNGGNNFYLDDININYTVGVENKTTISHFNIHPNPIKESAVINFSLTSHVQNLQIVLRDVLGNIVTRMVNNKSFNQGKYTMAIDRNKQLSSGLYFVEFNVDGRIGTKKVIVH